MSDDTALIDRSRGGAGTHASEAEKREVRLALLTDPECGTISACARRFGRRRETIAEWCRGPEFDELKKAIIAAEIEETRTELRKGWRAAAKEWVQTAVKAAAEKGDHRAAKDLLLHGHVIDPLQDAESGPKVVVQIGIKDSDVTLSPIPGNERR